MPKVSMHFSGSSPPEIFVGRSNYPNVFSGILSPTIKGNTEDLSLPERWVEDNLTIEQILDKRAMLVHGRNEGNVKNPKAFQKIMQEVAENNTIDIIIAIRFICAIKVNWGFPLL